MLLAPVPRAKESGEELRRKPFPPAFPAFQRSNLPIFRGEATSRKIGARPANQQRFMQLRGYEFRKFFRSIFPPLLPHLPLPWHSSLESVHFVGNLVGINSWFRRRNNTSGRIVNLNFTSFFFSFVFPLLCVTLIFFIARIKKMFLLRFFRAVN